MNPARFSTQSFFDSQLRDSPFACFTNYHLRVFTYGESEKIFICLFNSLGPASLVGKKEKVGWSAIFHFFPSRVSSRFLLVRSSQARRGRVPHDEGWFSQSVKTSQKVGKGLTIRKVMGGREIFKPQEFFSLSNSLYEFFLGHSMKFWGVIFLI